MDSPTVAKIGNVTKDPELRFGASSGIPFARFSIAVKPYVKSGEPEQETVFYNVTAFGSLAENVVQSIRKGNRVGVIGKGKVEEWTSKEGEPRTSKAIIADFVGPDLRFVVAQLHQPAPVVPEEPEEEF